MNAVLTEISKLGIVPVVAIDNAEDARPLAKALCAGGLPVAEVTFRTACAEEAIRIMASEFPDMLIGAGTVLTCEQVDKAVNAGAKFIVSPGLNPTVVKYCVDKGVPVTPGCSSPSDIERALELGLEVVKFFPAEAAGGLKMIKAMSAPYGKVKFMPTGGINASNLKDYLDFKKIIACGGSWMVDKALIKAKDFDKIEALTRTAVTEMLGFKLAHVGINLDSENNALELAKVFASFFGFESKNGNSSVFSGGVIELMKEPYLGKNGHIAIETNYLERAVYHLEKRGVQFDEDTKKFDAEGNFTAIYLKGDFGGFALHLVQKK
jgi:2-dehydro-3-deoxyphosphogluconate aldolase/(4S)-4-hydroxy-2-oxoglutarate aldolase